jgi:hypothetical protein
VDIDEEEKVKILDKFYQSSVSYILIYLDVQGFIYISKCQWRDKIFFPYISPLVRYNLLSNSHRGLKG